MNQSDSSFSSADDHYEFKNEPVMGSGLHNAARAGRDTSPQLDESSSLGEIMEQQPSGRKNFCSTRKNSGAVKFESDCLSKA